MSKILEMADKYAFKLADQHHTLKGVGAGAFRAALVAEVEKLEKGPNMLAFKEIIDQRNSHADMSRKLEEIICEKDEALELTGKTLRSVLEQAKDLIAERDALRALVTKLHAAKGRYHTQLAACDLFDAVGLKNERPVK